MSPLLLVLWIATMSVLASALPVWARWGVVLPAALGVALLPAGWWPHLWARIRGWWNAR